MSAYRLGEKAKADLEGIFDYILGQWGEERANKYLDEMIRCFERLAGSPGLGRRGDRLLPGVRRFEHGKHVIFYRVTGGEIHISRVLHQSSLPSRLRLIDSC